MSENGSGLQYLKDSESNWLWWLFQKKKKNLDEAIQK